MPYMVKNYVLYLLCFSYGVWVTGTDVTAASLIKNLEVNFIKYLLSILLSILGMHFLKTKYMWCRKYIN